MTETEKVYTIQDAEGLMAVWPLKYPVLHIGRMSVGEVCFQNENNGEMYLPMLRFLSIASPHQTGSEVRALCIECGAFCKCAYCKSYGQGSDFCTGCPHCQDGQVLYRITGDVELKQAKEVLDGIEQSAEDGGLSLLDWYFEQDLKGSDWVCVAPA